jgi:hypothetical protein
VIDLREKQGANASDRMRVNAESSSNEIVESSEQFEKQPRPRS